MSFTYKDYQEALHVFRNNEVNIDVTCEEIEDINVGMLGDKNLINELLSSGKDRITLLEGKENTRYRIVEDDK